jgi:energy-coupling factor transport system substrate-specific component
MLPADPAASAAGGRGGPRPRLSVRMSARDLLNTAVFAVIFMVAIWAVGMLGVISPLVWLITTPLQILAGGIPFMLLLTRVKHAGMVTLFSVVLALFFLFSGNSPVSTAGIILLGAVADLICWLGRYRSKWAAIWSCTVFGLGFLTPFLPLFIDRQAYFASATWETMGEDYIAATDQLLTAPVLGILAAAVAVTGFAAGLLGSAVLRKHFIRAGLA